MENSTVLSKKCLSKECPSMKCPNADCSQVNLVNRQRWVPKLVLTKADFPSSEIRWLYNAQTV